MPPPINDNCSSATNVVSLPHTITALDISGATVEGSEPTPTGESSVFNSVWYTYTPASTAWLHFDPTASDFTVHAAVYTGSCGTFTEVRRNLFNGKLNWEGVSGTTYYIQVYSPDSLGSGSLSATFRLATIRAGMEGACGVIGDFYDIAISGSYALAAFLHGFDNSILVSTTVFDASFTASTRHSDTCSSGIEYDLSGGESVNHQNAGLRLHYQTQSGSVNTSTFPDLFYQPYPYNGTMYSVELRFKCGDFNEDFNEVLTNGEVELRVNGTVLYTATGIGLGNTASTGIDGCSWDAFACSPQSISMPSMYIRTTNTYADDTWRVDPFPYTSDADTRYYQDFTTATDPIVWSSDGGPWQRYRYSIFDDVQAHPSTTFPALNDNGITTAAQVPDVCVLYGGHANAVMYAAESDLAVLPSSSMSVSVSPSSSPSSSVSASPSLSMSPSSSASPSSSVSSSVSASHSPSASPSPPFLDDLEIFSILPDCANSNIIITGTGFPNEPEWEIKVDGVPVTYTIVSTSFSQSVLHISPFPDGQYCVAASGINPLFTSDQYDIDTSDTFSILTTSSEFVCAYVFCSIQSTDPISTQWKLYRFDIKVRSEDTA